MEESIFNSVQRLTQLFIGKVKTAPEVDAFESDLEYALLDQFYRDAPTVTLVYNHFTLGYNYFSPNVKQVFGYEGEDFMLGGLRFAMSLVHPIDSKIYNTHIIPSMFRYMGHYMLKGQVKDLKFTFSFRIKNKNGNYIWAMHQMSVVKTSFLGIPTLTQTNISDVTGIKKDDTIDFAIHRKTERNEYDLLFNKIYHPEELPVSISGRELDVLKLLAQGKTSLEIIVKK
jgi:PAS domain-containing protein